jgi:hypothetical protein
MTGVGRSGVRMLSVDGRRSERTIQLVINVDRPVLTEVDKEPSRMRTDQRGRRTEKRANPTGRFCARRLPPTRLKNTRNRSSGAGRVDIR